MHRPTPVATRHVWLWLCLVWLLTACGSAVAPASKVVVLAGGEPGVNSIEGLLVRDALDHHLSRRRDLNVLPFLRAERSVLSGSLGTEPLERQQRWLRDNGVDIVVQATQSETGWNVVATTWPDGKLVWSRPLVGTSGREIWSAAPEWGAALGERLTGQDPSVVAGDTSSVLPAFDWRQLAEARQRQHAASSEAEALPVVLYNAYWALNQRSDTAANLFDRVLADHPTDPWALAGGAVAASRAQRYDDARTRIARARAALPENAELMDVEVQVEVIRLLATKTVEEVSYRSLFERAVKAARADLVQLAQLAPKRWDAVERRTLVLRALEAQPTAQSRALHDLVATTPVAAEMTPSLLPQLLEEAGSETRLSILNSSVAIDWTDATGRSRYHHAAHYGVCEVIEEAARDAAVDAPDAQGRTPLLLAAQAGHRGCVDSLLSRNANLAHRDIHGFSALHLAAWKGHTRLAIRLVEAGARLEARTEVWETPLQLAVLEGHAEVATALIEHGASLDASDAEGWTPISASLRRAEHPTVAKRAGRTLTALLRHPSVDSTHKLSALLEGLALGPTDGVRRVARSLGPSAELNRVLHHAVDLQKPPLVAPLVNAGADVTALHIDGRAPLLRAVRQGNSALLEALGPFGKDWRDSYQRSLLDLGVFEAVDADKPSLVSTLVAQGARSTARGPRKRTALHVSVLRERLRMTRALLDAGFSEAAQDERGQTPVHLAVLLAATARRKNHRWRVLQDFARKDGALDVLDGQGMTPSYVAVRRKRLKLLQHLVSLGAKGDVFSNAWLGDVDRLKAILAADSTQLQRRDPRGWSPLAFAVERSSLEAVQYLLSKGADPNLVIKDTPLLMRAAKRCRPKVLTALLKGGADADARSGDGETALHQAVDTCLPNVRALLAAKPSVDMQDKVGDTPLHRAARAKKRTTLQALLSAGANPDLKNAKGETAKSIWPEGFRPVRVGSIGRLGGGGRYGRGSGAGYGRGLGKGGGARMRVRAPPRPKPVPTASGVRFRQQVENDIVPLMLPSREFTRLGWLVQDDTLARRQAVAGAVVEAARTYEGLRALLARRRPVSSPYLARTHQNLGRMLTLTGELDRAVELLDQAVEALRSNRRLSAVHWRARENRALANERRGHLKTALTELQAVLQWRRERSSSVDRTITQDRVASLLADLGRFRDAEAEWTQALGERTMPPQLAPSLTNNFGLMLRLVGDHAAAKARFHSGLRILEHLRERGMDLGRATVLEAALSANRGLQRLREGDSVGGLADLDSAERLLVPVGGVELAELRVSRAWVALERGESTSAALSSAQTAVDRATGAAHPLQAELLTLRSEVALGGGSRDEAERYAWQALSVADASGAPRVRWLVRHHLAQVLEAQGRRNAAIFMLKDAVNVLQQMRGEAGARAAHFLVDNVSVYRELAGWLVEGGRLAEAEHVVSLLKAEELSQWRRRAGVAPSGAQVPMTARELEIAKTFAAVRSDLVQRARTLARLRQALRAGTLTDDERTQMKALRADIRAGRRAFAASIDQIQASLQDAGKSAPNLRTVRAMQSVLASVGEGVVAVHFVATDDAVHLLFTTPHIQLAERAKVTAIELNRMVFDVRQEMSDPEGDPSELLEALYGHLIAPLADDLQKAGARTLLVSLDGPLRYLPIGALHDGDRYLVERYEVVRLTEATRDKLEKPPERGLKVAGLGVSKQLPGFSALPSVPSELDAIVRVSPDDKGVADGVVHLDEAFHGDSFLDVLDLGYPVVHIASHFEFKAGTFRDSFLLLGDGKHLSLESMRYDYSFNDVDLLTLSACNTGMSGTDADGREVEGLGAMVQNLGARSVLATLWPVEDASTGALMARFYRARGDGATKAAALRRAQLALIASAEGTGDDWSHPYYWAPVVLMGNWL